MQNAVGCLTTAIGREYDACNTYILYGGFGMDRIRKLLNRETILYLVFGVATTLVNYIVFFLCYEWIYGRDNSPVANAIAFVAAVVFAFVVNKAFVFESKSWNVDALKREIPPFMAARIGSFLIEEAGLFLCEDVMHLGNVTVMTIGDIALTGVTVAKIGLSFVVVVVNYVFCKFFVFKK